MPLEFQNFFMKIGMKNPFYFQQIEQKLGKLATNDSNFFAAHPYRIFL